MSASIRGGQASDGNVGGRLLISPSHSPLEKRNSDRRGKGEDEADAAENGKPDAHSPDEVFAHGLGSRAARPAGVMIHPPLNSAYPRRRQLWRTRSWRRSANGKRDRETGPLNLAKIDRNSRCCFVSSISLSPMLDLGAGFPKLTERLVGIRTSVWQKRPANPPFDRQSHV